MLSRHDNILSLEVVINERALVMVILLSTQGVKLTYHGVHATVELVGCRCVTVAH